MKKGLLILALILWSGAVFGAGYVYHQHRLLHGGRFVTTKPLTLSAGLNHGELPAGSTLYSFGGPDEQPHFVLVVGTTALNAMQSQPSDHWLEVSPDVAFDPAIEQ